MRYPRDAPSFNSDPKVTVPFFGAKWYTLEASPYWWIYGLHFCDFE